MSERVIKFVRHPSFTQSEWSTRNPFLERGEVAFELFNGEIYRYKVGPGLWNDLDYQDSIYDFTGAVVSPIGDATGDLAGTRVTEILRRMLNEYQIPVFTTPTNNAGSGFANVVIKEIGQSINSAVTVVYGISNSLNLSGGTPIVVDTDNVFIGDGNVVNNGAIILTPSAPISPVNLLTVNIGLKAIHDRGVTDEVFTQIKFQPRIMWVSSSLQDMPDGSTFMSLSGRQSIVTDDYKRDYTFNNTGYPWLAIPEMLGPTNMFFADVKNPLLSLPFGVIDKGSIMINNGVSSYSYRLLRGTYNLLSSSKLRVA